MLPKEFNTQEQRFSSSKDPIPFFSSEQNGIVTEMPLFH